MIKLTQARLKEVLYYNPDEGIFIRRINTSNTFKGDVAGGPSDSKGYCRISIEGQRYLSHRIAWLYIHGYFPEHDIDHINRDKQDNRLVNLREVTRAANLRNAGNPKDNTSGVKGVRWFSRTNKWIAQLTIERNPIHLGYHEDLLEAACHRLAAEQAECWCKHNKLSPAFLYVQSKIKGII